MADAKTSESGIKRSAVTNWKTTVGAGVAGILVIVLNVYVIPNFEGVTVSFKDVVSHPDFVPLATSLLTGIGLILGGLFSRDFDKSSQQSGARPSDDQIKAEIDARVEAEIAARVDAAVAAALPPSPPPGV